MKKHRQLDSNLWMMRAKNFLKLQTGGVNFMEISSPIRYRINVSRVCRGDSFLKEVIENYRDMDYEET